jgi:fatty acid-binding protein DegV
LPDLRFGTAFCHACAPELLDKAIACMKEPLKLVDWLTCSIGSVIGTYSGRGVVGFAYIAEEPNPG